MLIMSLVEIIDLQRYWWHLYVEILVYGRGEETGLILQLINYLPELMPDLGEEEFASSNSLPRNL